MMRPDSCRGADRKACWEKDTGAIELSRCEFRVFMNCDNKKVCQIDASYPSVAFKAHSLVFCAEERMKIGNCSGIFNLEV